jgi:hypothetical protein
LTAPAVAARRIVAIAALPGAGAPGDLQLIAGDFNATLDHRVLRRLLGRGYADAADAAGDGLTWTWPARDHRALVARLRLPRRA